LRVRRVRIAPAARILTLIAFALFLAACSVGPRREEPPPPSAPVPVPTPPPVPDITSIPDAVPKFEPRSKRGNPPFYTVMGKRYTVLESAEGYVERGVASWYGPKFHGQLTSMGERYDMYAMTAAHKTLPLPAYARVTNLRNGKSVIVRINDRGPFVDNRIIDLSYTAAAKLDMIREGTTLVEVRAITPGKPAPVITRAEEQPPPELFVQAGAFAEEANAIRLRDRLRAAGLSNVMIVAPPERGQRLFRVRLGPVSSVAEFDRLVERLRGFGIADAHLAID
jgi:rare lipoprotein A